jgi:mono/diheme cytochrome c family protein
VRAIAAYMASVLGEPTPERRRQGDALLARTRNNAPGGKPNSADLAGDSKTIAGQGGEPVRAGGDVGAMIYVSACATCHESGRPLPFGGIDLALSTAMQGLNAHNVINVVLAGLPAAEGERSPIMPGFSGVLTDQQVIELVGYLRSRFSDKPQWTDTVKDVRDARTGARSGILHPSHGTGPAPADTTQREKPW